MKTIHINKVFDVQKKYKDIIEKCRENALDKLLGIDNSDFDYQDRKYLRFVIYLFKMKRNSVLLLNPFEIKQLISSSLPPNSGSQKRHLKHYIIDALNYKKYRESFYPSYFKDLGISSCVYCNSQLTISIGKKIKS